MSKENKYSALVIEAADYVAKIFSEISSDYLYHNFVHTQQVVDAAAELAEGFNLNKTDKEIVLLAGYFHDIAYSIAEDNHEVKGVEIARTFLESKNYNPDSIQKIEQCILATKMGSQPKTLLEKIIKDADCAHLGKKNIERRSDLLRMEWELINGKYLEEMEWIKININFLENHHYCTTIAKTEWGQRKDKHLKKLKNQLDSFEKSTNKKDTKIKDSAPVKKSKGVETMFRVTLRNHINLSRIADNKANFLLSISGIILSLLLGELITDNKPVQSFLLPTMYFMVICVITMILSILATRPNVTKGKFSKEGILNKKSNILFFGNFHAMPLEDFSWGINKLMEDDELLYDSLTKDLYYLGVVLHKKYRYLRYAFNFFMFGIISSAIFYAVMQIIS